MGRTLRRQWPVIALAAAALAVAVVAFMVESNRHDAPSYPTHNYSLIEDGLYLGGSLSEAPPGTRAVLNLCETKDPFETEVYRWESIPDRAPAPSIDWLRRQVEFVDQQRRGGLPVFVHCAAGISRGAMVTTAYLMARDRISRDDALARIRAKRPAVAPNPAFMQLLLDWQEVLNR